MKRAAKIMVSVLAMFLKAAKWSSLTWVVCLGLDQWQSVGENV